jgi:transketolase
MRTTFCRSLVAEVPRHRPDFVFLTGDLGFMALEPLRDALGPRFLNAGVAEQNMVSVAAGLARNGLRPWVYSIAPFVYARPFEQIRNDVCFHRLPVVLVGNGGGYGYGVMGATHHALEDYGVLLCLPELRAYLPVFDGDLPALTARLFAVDHPAYLRLGLDEGPKDVSPPPYAPWRRLEAGGGWVVLAAGALAGAVWNAVRTLDPGRRPALWVVSELPPDELPGAFLDDLARVRRLLVVEEHVAHGGLGQMIARSLLEAGQAPDRFVTRTARGYVSGRYGSQAFHRRESGLDPASLLGFLASGEA